MLLIKKGELIMCSEYIMSQRMANLLLKERKGNEKNMENQAYLCKIVNEQCGLLYPCVKVTVIND